jgi:NADH:ubiquinone oxidoreductase subunit 5 (subunit L)/multisubunit Na+/H+ antiporter MnhA subunit
MSAFTVAAAGMAGIPFVAGFVSKFYMLIGAIGMTNASYAYEPTAAGAIFALALVVSGVMNIAYFWPVVYTAFFESEDEHDAKPLVEFPLGGKWFDSDEGAVAADGGHEERNPNHTEHRVSEQAQEEAEHETHHGGPPVGGWDRRSPREESTWLVLMPITAIVIGAVVLGIIPGEVAFLDLVQMVAEQITGLEVNL